MPGFRLIAVFCIAFAMSACAVRPVAPPAETLQGEAVNPIRAALQNGDWLVARGVHLADNLVATVTDKPLSHAAVYDAKSDEVIEVDGSGVHTTPLAGFVANSTRVLVIQPMWATPENRPQAVARVRQWLGRGYNFTGLIGLSMPERYYCSQLVVQAYEPFIDHGPRQNPIPHIIEPGQLYHWGRIVYDSGP